MMMSSRPVCLDRPADQFVYLRFRRHVHGERRRPAAGLPDAVSDLLRPGEIEVGDHDDGAFLTEAVRTWPDPSPTRRR